MARLNEKSDGVSLYACVAVTCRVITFIPKPGLGPICPGCGEDGAELRAPIWATDYRARSLSLVVRGDETDGVA